MREQDVHSLFVICQGELAEYAALTQTTVSTRGALRPSPTPRVVYTPIGPGLGALCLILWLLWGRELPHGQSLLHDYLVFTAVLVSEVGYFVPELRYERGIVGAYPFVLAVVDPSSCLWRIS